MSSPIIQLSSRGSSEYLKAPVMSEEARNTINDHLLHIVHPRIDEIDPNKDYAYSAAARIIPSVGSFAEFRRGKNIVDSLRQKLPVLRGTACQLLTREFDRFINKAAAEVNPSQKARLTGPRLETAQKLDALRPANNEFKQMIAAGNRKSHVNFQGAGKENDQKDHPIATVASSSAGAMVLEREDSGTPLSSDISGESQKAPLMSQASKKLLDDYLFETTYPNYKEINTDKSYLHSDVVKIIKRYGYFCEYSSGQNIVDNLRKLSLSIPNNDADPQIAARFYQGTVCQLLMGDFDLQVAEGEEKVEQFISSEASLTDEIIQTANKLDVLRDANEELVRLFRYYQIHGEGEPQVDFPDAGEEKFEEEEYPIATATAVTSSSAVGAMVETSTEDISPSAPQMAEVINTLPLPPRGQVVILPAPPRDPVNVRAQEQQPIQKTFAAIGLS